MLFKILLFTVKYQHESAIGIHEPPSHLPPHPTPPGWYRASEFPETYSKFPLAIYFIYGNVSFHVTLSIHLTLSSPLPTIKQSPLSLFYLKLLLSDYAKTLSYSIEPLMCVLFIQSCSTLCNPMDCSLPGSSVHVILQARILECVTIPFSRGSS